jgi:beta-phosphoglucomutase-like phosphatase (HAD superfamily)
LAHDPATAEQRRRRASRGGKGKANRRITALWEKVEDVIGGVEVGRLESPQGNTMLRGYSTLIGLARFEVEQAELEIAQRRLELDVEERTELIKEVEELRELLEARKDNRWGA